MSKKKFTDGLESLFSLPSEEMREPENVLVVEKEKIKGKRKKKKIKRRSYGKSFTSDLDALFSGIPANRTNEETNSEKDVQKLNIKKTQKAKTPRIKVAVSNPVIGLDALLRSTVDPSPYNKTEAPTDKKRVTFTFNKKKLLKLKRIAKIEKLYLKDIIGGAVSEFIQEYESNKGAID